MVPAGSGGSIELTSLWGLLIVDSGHLLLPSLNVSGPHQPALVQDPSHSRSTSSFVLQVCLRDRELLLSRRCVGAAGL